MVLLEPQNLKVRNKTVLFLYKKEIREVDGAIRVTTQE